MNRGKGKKGKATARNSRSKLSNLSKAFAFARPAEARGVNQRSLRNRTLLPSNEPGKLTDSDLEIDVGHIEIINSVQKKHRDFLSAQADHSFWS